MLSALRTRINPATVIATIALVFALTGGAYAAGKYLITSTKQIKPSVLASLKGKAGPAGPAGPAGAAGVGTAGPAGSQGPAGPNGPAGPEGKTGPKGEQGVKGVQGIQGLEGKEGSPWTAGGTLPSGRTETGVWSIAQSNISQPSQKLWVPISFPIPLPAESTKAFFFNQEQTEEKEFGTSGCTGTLNEPKAPSGTLCVYTGPEGNTLVEAKGVFQIEGPSGYRKSGAILEFRAGLGASAATPARIEMSGSWAVTAP